MKINEVSSNLNQIGNLETPQSRTKESGSVDTQTAEKENQKGAQVEISSTSVEFSRAAEKMDEVPKERADKIDQLKMAVQNGTYNVDSKEIAEKVVDDSINNII